MGIVPFTNHREAVPEYSPGRKPWEYHYVRYFTPKGCRKIYPLPVQGGNIENDSDPALTHRAIFRHRFAVDN